MLHQFRARRLAEPVLRVVSAPRGLPAGFVLRPLAPLVLGALLVAAVAGGASADPTTASATSAASAQTQDELDRGRYLANIMGCHDCHTPKKFGPAGPEFDMSRELSGHPEGSTPAPIAAGALDPMGWAAACNGHMTAWVGPWGTTFAINLTPDPDTGIGSWSEAMFVKALRTGKHMGEGRPILPPMPVATFAHASDADLSALFAYLRSVRPVKNIVPDPLPPAGAGQGQGR